MPDSDRTICGYTVHEAAALFPLITGADFESLVDDIREHGLLEPIVLDSHEQIIDGRNRGRACERIGLRPATKTFTGDDVLQFVVSHNLHRRHLTDSQRTMIAAKLATRTDGQRQQHDHMIALPPSVAEAAELLHVRPANVHRAKRITRDGSEELQALVIEGHAPVVTAARVAVELDPEGQEAYVAAVRGGADPVKAAPPPLAAREGERRRVAERATRSDFHKGTHHIHPERIIEESITTLEAVAVSLDLVKGITSSMDADKRVIWLAALDPAMAAINLFRKELK